MRFDNVLAVVLARHATKPYVEGGGKAMLDLAHALSDANIDTLFFSFNYPSYSTDYVSSRNHEKYMRFDVKIGLLSQDIVLNTAIGSITSSIVESFIGGVLVGARYANYIKRSRDKKVCLSFIGNASKYLSLVFKSINNLSRLKEKRVFVLMQRGELRRLSLRILKPHLIIATSRELAKLARKVFPEKEILIEHVYPPIQLNPSGISRLEIENMVFRELADERFLLYLGRVNYERFPLSMLKQLLLTLREVDKRAKIVIVTIPERRSTEWVKRTKEIARKCHASNNLIVMTRILTNKEKSVLYSMARGFIFPSSSSSTAIEPPLTVLESIAYGTPIITTGTSSTKEITRFKQGFVYSKPDELRVFTDFVLNSNASRNFIKEWAMKNLNYANFSEKLRSIIFRVINSPNAT